MKCSISFYFLVALLLNVLWANGQRIIHRPGSQDFYPIDANGRPFQFDTRYKMDGSPFFYGEYAQARIVTLDGKVFEEIPVKFNVAEKQVQYQKLDGTEMVALIAIKSIYFSSLQLEDGSFINAWLTSDKGAINEPASVIYQIIDSGKVSLAKKIDISYHDEKKYGEATVTRQFDRKETPYVILPTGEYRKIEKGSSFFIEILKDKQKQVSAFIDNKDLKCKSMQDYRQVISYYNTL